MNIFALTEEVDLWGIPSTLVNPIICGTVTLLVVVTILMSMRRK